MVHKKVVVPIYNRTIYMFKGKYREAMEYFNLKYKSDLPMSEDLESNGCVISFIDGSCILIIQKESPPTIAHEICHVVQGILNNLLKDTDRNTAQETEAYLTGWVTEQYYKKSGWK